MLQALIVTLREGVEAALIVGITLAYLSKIKRPDLCRVVYIAPHRFEAPNWMPDGMMLLFNRNGGIEKIPLAGGTPQVLDTGFATRCNNDHLISPDGTQLGISDNSQENHQSLVYIVPIGGGAPRRITQKSPSYLHGWSRDGKTLAFGATAISTSTPFP